MAFLDLLILLASGQVATRAVVPLPQVVRPTVVPVLRQARRLVR
jgi:hypothetical protein